MHEIDELFRQKQPYLTYFARFFYNGVLTYKKHFPRKIMLRSFWSILIG